jgi:hypothetical protein
MQKSTLKDRILILFAINDRLTSVIGNKIKGQASNLQLPLCGPGTASGITDIYIKDAYFMKAFRSLWSTVEI